MRSSCCLGGRASAAFLVFFASEPEPGTRESVPVRDPLIHDAYRSTNPGRVNGWMRRFTAQRAGVHP